MSCKLLKREIESIDRKIIDLELLQSEAKRSESIYDNLDKRLNKSRFVSVYSEQQYSLCG